VSELNTSGANIIQMTRTPAHNAVFPALAQVEAYWHGLCDTAPLPHRRDVDPRGLTSALEFTFVLERVAPGVARFRIAGHHLNDLMGLNVGGMPITAMFEPGARAEIAAVIESVFVEPCIKLVQLSARRTLGRGALRGKMMLAPLLDDAGEVTRILGCLQTAGTIGRQPRRFSVGEVQTKELSSQPVAKPAPAQPRHAFAEAARAFAHAAAPEPCEPVNKSENSRPALQLVVDNA